MALDIAKTAAQIDSMAGHLADATYSRTQQVDRLMAALATTDAAELAGRVEASRGRPFLCATPEDALDARYQPSVLPADFSVASVDGSHIDVDRHIPVRCYLINIGGCVFTYGSHPDARLFSQPALYAAEEDIFLNAPATTSNDSVAVQGAVLGMLRTVKEVEGLAEAAESADPALPLLALLDGSLVMWGLAGRGYPPFLREKLLGEMLMPALDSLQAQAARRSLVLAAYVSLPQTTEVLNTLRLALCQQREDICQQSCTSFRSAHSPCDSANGLLDRHIFQELLAPGERSGIYRSNSSVSREYYGPHQVCFYYLNTGTEIGRVEVPLWVAQDENRVALSHTLVMDQVRRGMGYPAAIAEAHEQAVVTGQDRETFRKMVDAALERRHLPVYTSEKNRSKGTRWL